MARKVIRTLVGLDLSATATGLVARRSGETILAIKIKPPKDLIGLPRICWIADEITRILDELPGPVMVFQEDFAFAATNKAHELGGLGYAVRKQLIEAGFGVWIVPIGVNKKHATGKGNAKKSTMMLHVYKRWGFDTDDDNLADGFALAMCGEAFLVPPHNDVTRKIHTTLRRETIHVS